MGALSAFLSLLALTSYAPRQDGYRLPPPEVVDLLEAPPSPRVDFSPDGRWMLVLELEAMPSIADVSRPMLPLAGIRIDPGDNGPYRTGLMLGLLLRATGEEDSGESVRVPLPGGHKLVGASWSHDARHFLFITVGRVGDTGTRLYAASVEEPGAPRLVSARLNTVLVAPRFMPDGESLLFAEVPVSRGEQPSEPVVPRGPNIQGTSGELTPLRTYQDLLSSSHDEALFEHYARSVLVVDGVSSSARRVLGDAGLYSRATPSPSGAYLLVTRIERPWSYLMPYYNFAQRIEVRGGFGNTVHTVAELPPAENIPIGGVRTGPRYVGWKAGEPATLVWVEALDGGDPEAEVDFRDQWFSLAAPFEEEPRELLRVEERARGLSFLAGRTDRLISREYDRDRRWVRSLLHELSPQGVEPVVLEDRSVRDRYGDPGTIRQTRDASGSRVVRVDGEWIYRAGSGASPVGYLPFLDRQNLETLETERLWRCSKGSYETVAHLMPAEEGSVPAYITRYETPELPPNYRLHRDGEVRSITEDPDPTPQIRGIEKQLVTYEREDGVPLSATLYTPADHEPGKRLPLLVWAYPIEFNDRRTAGQVSSSPWRFTRIRGSSHLALVTQGYAVMDGATMPVIGDPETMNDTFVEQIVAAAEAAIRKADELGVGDPNRVGVGGHSYGAFMTANLLAHSDLFKAGIARSGAYNRTLTPFGFQSERRPIWEAPETYFSVSPFFHADELKEPVLLIHGEIDNNSGTFPMQSQRLFQALKGNGGTARLVMLPNESHGYRARESVLHVQAEMIEWLDEHVKGEMP